MIRAIIFDFDGLILDTESADFLAWREICQAYGCDLSFPTWAQGVGVSLEMFDLRDYLWPKSANGT
jgi:putative hydrolase of the HAD superfamily